MSRIRLSRPRQSSGLPSTALWVVLAANAIVLGTFYREEVGDTFSPAGMLERVGLIEPQSDRVFSPPAAPTFASAISTLRFAVDLARLHDVVRPSADAHIVAYQIAEAPNFETRLDISGEMVVDLKRRLSAQGYLDAEPTDVIDEAMRAAIRAWQREYGFLVTGYLDRATMTSIQERTAHGGADWIARTATPEDKSQTVTAPSTEETPPAGSFGTITEQTSARP